jgi:HTH-type transcriptional regulator/antitoxin HigA
MNIKPIHNSQDYQEALSAIDGLMSAAHDTPEGDQLDVLVTLVEAWEREYCPMPAPDPVEAIRFVMEQRGLEVKDLVPMIGKTNRIYEVLNRKRPLTLSMIKRLHKGLGIPAELLL